MSQRYVMHPTCSLHPHDDGGFELRLPLFGRRMVVAPYFAQLLEDFAVPEDPKPKKGGVHLDPDVFDDSVGKTLDEVLARYPVRKADIRAFLNDCIADGFLVEPSLAKAPVDRVPAEHCLAGLPAFDATKPAAFTFLGIAWDASTTGRPGARFGPSEVRQAASSLEHQLDPIAHIPLGFADMSAGKVLLRGIQVADAGDVYLAPGEPMEVAFDRVTRVASELWRSGTIPLFIGGDHAITYALLRAFAQRQQPVQVLHIDAHTDLGDALPGQRLHHGNVFEMVLRDFDDVEALVQVGLRGLYGASVIEHPIDVEQFGMDRFRQEGIDGVLNALDESLPVYVSFDIDGLDPAFAPSTGTPVPGGLFVHEVKALLREVGRRFDVIGADLVEVAGPEEALDPTAYVALEALLTLADATVEGMRERLLSQ